MQGVEVAEAFHEPAWPSNRSLLWESGAEDARTPDASRLSGVSEPREAFGVRPIYRRFPSGVGRPQFMVPMHGVKVVEAFHERDGKNNASLRVGWRFLTLTHNPTLNRGAESKSKITSTS